MHFPAGCRCWYGSDWDAKCCPVQDPWLGLAYAHGAAGGDACVGVRDAAHSRCTGKCGVKAYVPSCCATSWKGLQKACVLTGGNHVQETPDTAEALACVPTLQLEDIPKEAASIPTDISEQQNVTMLQHELFTNDVLYMETALDMRTLPPNLLPLIPLFCRCAIRSRMESEQPHTACCHMLNHCFLRYEAVNRLPSSLDCMRHAKDLATAPLADVGGWLRVLPRLTGLVLLQKCIQRFGTAMWSVCLSLDVPAHHLGLHRELSFQAPRVRCRTGSAS